MRAPTTVIGASARCQSPVTYPTEEIFSPVAFTSQEDWICQLLCKYSLAGSASVAPATTIASTRKINATFSIRAENFRERCIELRNEIRDSNDIRPVLHVRWDRRTQY